MEYLLAIIIYCLTTHATIFFLRFFCNLRICVNPSILCTHSWSNTFQIPTQKRVVQQIHFSFLPTIFCLAAHHEFPFTKNSAKAIGKYNDGSITIYGYFSPYFQGHYSPFANSFFHAYQNETNFAWSSSPRGITIKYQTWVFDLFFLLSCMFEEWKKSKWVVYPLIITSTHETYTQKTVNYNLKWEICGPFYKTFIFCNILFYFFLSIMLYALEWTTENESLE